jgi:di/tricarboxylate transporter
MPTTQPGLVPQRLPLLAITALVFVLVVAAAGLGIAPIAAAAFAGAVALILLGVLTPDEAYSGLKPDILLLIAGMVVVGTAITGVDLQVAAYVRALGS